MGGQRKMSLLELNGVCKNFKDFKIEDITFELPKGYILGYIGENGAGKTTTMNLITHLKHCDKGEIKIDGITFDSNPTKYKEQIGFIGDESYFPKDFNIRIIRKTCKEFYPTFDEEKFNSLVKEWNLPERKNMGSFSRGMKVKLMFACVLCRETKLLILDEATNGLDPVMKEEVIEMLQEYVEDGERSVLFSTHELEDLEEIADYIIFLKKGKILYQNTKDDLMEDFLTIKGEEGKLSEIQKAKLIGQTNHAYHFQALITANDAEEFGFPFIMEKPSMKDIVLHMIKDNNDTKIDSRSDRKRGFVS